MCKSWCELILGVIILVFTLWSNSASKWVVLIAAIVLIVHSFACKKCMVACSCSTESVGAKKRR